MFIYALFFLLFLPSPCDNIEYCDDCEFTCCQSFLSCANYQIDCICQSQYCRYGCCNGEICGSSTYCQAPSNKLAMTAGGLASVCIGLCIIFSCYRCIRRKRKKHSFRSIVVDNRSISNHRESNGHRNHREIDIIEDLDSMSSGNNILNIGVIPIGQQIKENEPIKPQINCVFIGKPIEFPENNYIDSDDKVNKNI